MKLIKHVILNGVIHCETGLRIGGSKDDIEIGGMDNPIIRHPVTNLPYIPGSSLKGRMRSLLELKYCQHTQRTGEPCRCGECLVCRIFGSYRNTSHQLGPTRVLFRDANLTGDSESLLKEAQKEKGLNFTEVKTENWINRKTGRAADGGLRTQERVPADTEFDFEIILRVFDEDDEEKNLDFIKEGLFLVQQEYLGGSGSRGYGKVKFINATVDRQPFTLE